MNCAAEFAVSRGKVIVGHHAMGPEDVAVVSESFSTEVGVKAVTFQKGTHGKSNVFGGATCGEMLLKILAPNHIAYKDA